VISSRRTWQLHEPFVISRGSSAVSEVIVVEVRQDGRAGRGEAKGVRYHGETLDDILEQIELVRDLIEAGATRQELQAILPACGARNALDAALWDLDAKLTRRPVWELAGVPAPTSLVSCFTIGIRSVDAYEERARSLSSYPWLKVKVGTDDPVAAVAAVRRGAPHSRLVIDANQAWSVAQLQEFAPRLAELEVDLLEQPISGEDDAALRDLELPVPVCADEPVNTVAELPRLVDRYDFINIKLDKSGGLTAALELAYAARAAGLRLMVGCNVGSSLAMAPAMIVGTLCEVVDLDGPLLQSEDWPHALVFDNGHMSLPSPLLWGS
jgi:L-alanine-DL-glutamate epimerase-like enolase superfamily enzyme